MPKNDNAKCPPGQHEHEASLEEAGTETCRWCGDVREAPVALLGDVSAHVVLVVVEDRRAA